MTVTQLAPNIKMRAERAGAACVEFTLLTILKQLPI
jgi:hypothetical protein